MGLNIASYMKELQEDEDAYKRQFSDYIKNGVNATNVISKNRRRKFLVLLIFIFFVQDWSYV